MHRRIAATLVALSWLAFTSPARGDPSLGLQPKAPADTQPVNGEWRSGERFDGHARATLVVNGAAGSLTGVLTLLGLTNGDDNRATLRVPFRDGAWDGTTLSFEITLPNGEEKARWTLRVTAPGKATLGLATDDGGQADGAPKWEMSRP